MSQMSTSEKLADWERPWATEDIRKNSQNWTLAGDSGLFNRLQFFSQHVINKTDKVQENLDSLEREIKATSSRIHNAVNEFLMLSNIQFVENRVYDEEIVDETTIEDRKNENDAERTKEQREAELVPRISCALNLGLKIVDDAFEKLEVVDSESENEDGPSYVQLPVLEPKDPYLLRPLPYVIGSDKFMQNENVGLLDEENESDQESVSESENSVIKDETKSPLHQEGESESEPESKKQIKSLQSKDDSESENESQISDNDFFGSKSSGHYVDSEEEAINYNNEQKQLSDQKNDPFASELAAKLSKQLSIEKDVQDSDNPDDKHTQSKSKMMKQKQMFVEHYDDDSLFFNSEGLFTGSVSLFDSPSDEKEDLFSDIDRHNVGSSRKVQDGILPSSKDTIHSSSSSEEKSSSTSPAIPSTKLKEKKSSLFDEDDDDDIFTDKARTTSKYAKQNETTDLFKDIFNDEEVLFDSKITSKKNQETSSTEATSKKTLPAGAVSLFGTAVNPMMTALKSRSQNLENKIHNKESDSLDRERSDSHSSKSSISVKKQQENADVNKKSDSSKNLIPPRGELLTDETNDIDIFSQKQSKSANSSHPAVKSLFDDDSDDSDILFNPSGSSSKAGSKSIAQISDRTSQKDFSINGSSKYGGKSTPELDGSHSKKTEIDSKNKVLKGQVSLFDGEDYESDDIFSVSSVKDELTSTKERGKNIFADDQLFSETFEDSPSIDIFKTDEIKILESNPEITRDLTKSSTSKGLSPGLDLFDDTEDDIFSPKIKLPGKPPIPTPRKTSLPKEDHKGTEALDASLAETLQKTKVDTSIKKPIEGVKLFQGIDIFGGMSKDTQKERDKTEVLPEEVKQRVENAIVPLLTTTTTTTTISSSREISKNEEVAVSFDNPAVVNPLLNMGKGRAKMQMKRRLPSRKKNKTLADNIDSDFVSTKIGETTDVKEAFKDLILENKRINKTTLTPDVSQPFSADLASPKLDSLTVNGAGIVTSPSTEEDDLFSLTEQVAPALISRIEKKPRTDLSDIYPSESEDNGEENSIFSPVKADGNAEEYSKIRAVDGHQHFVGTTEDKLKREDESSGGLFPSASHFISSLKNANVFAENKDSTNSPSKKTKSTKSLFTDDDSDSDDLFADLSSKKGLTNRTTSKSTLVKPSNMSNKTQHSLFDDSDDNDDLDIFSDSLITKK